MGTTTTFIFLNQHYASPSTSLLQSHYRTPLHIDSKCCFFVLFLKKLSFRLKLHKIMLVSGKKLSQYGKGYNGQINHVLGRFCWSRHLFIYVKTKALKHPDVGSEMRTDAPHKKRRLRWGFSMMVFLSVFLFISLPPLSAKKFLTCEIEDELV